MEMIHTTTSVGLGTGARSHRLQTTERVIAMIEESIDITQEIGCPNLTILTGQKQLDGTE